MGRTARGTGDRHGAFRMGAGGRLRWAIKGADQSRRHPGYSAVEVAARLATLSFAAGTDYAVDDFIIAVKRRESNVLRGEASNAVNSAPTARAGRKRIRPPKRQKVYLVVHRHDNTIYYKRLNTEAFAILSALNRGATVEDACIEPVNASVRTEIDWSAQIKEWVD